MFETVPKDCQSKGECSTEHRQIRACVCLCVRACVYVCVCVCLCVCMCDPFHLPAFVPLRSTHHTHTHVPPASPPALQHTTHVVRDSRCRLLQHPRCRHRRCTAALHRICVRRDGTPVSIARAAAVVVVIIAAVVATVVVVGEEGGPLAQCLCRCTHKDNTCDRQDTHTHTHTHTHATKHNGLKRNGSWGCSAKRPSANTSSSSRSSSRPGRLTSKELKRRNNATLRAIHNRSAVRQDGDTQHR